MNEKNAVPFYKGPLMLISFIVITVGVALWLMLTRTWPASELISWQADMFDGRYYPKATFAVIWIGIVILCFALIALIGWLKSIISGEIRK